MRVALIYTSFPKDSETFLQREAREFLKLQGERDVEFQFYSLWGGKKNFEGHAVQRLGTGGILKALARGILLTFTRPSMWKLFWPREKCSWVGFWENALGLAGGVVWARALAQADWVHAQWGGAPAMCAFAASKLTRMRYSMGLHAYDLWEKGGNAFLRQKVEKAEAIFSSNDAAFEEVRRRFSSKEACRIRRGLAAELLEKEIPRRQRQMPLVLGIGRLVEKKGFADFIKIAAALKDRGIAFEAEIIGDGPLREKLQRQNECAGAPVTLAGWRNEAEVRARLSEAELMLFNGQVAKNGDRDGFPNTIGEAFAAGTVVIANDVSGVAEGVFDNQTGKLMQTREIGAWAETIQALLADAPLKERLRQNAQKWARANFNARLNAEESLKHFDRLAKSPLD